MHSRTDTEILLLAWERWGAQALPRLVGQWAFAVFDTVERRLWLVRDRFGEKPLFYHENTESLVFASSLEALVQHPQVPRQLDPECLVEYVTLRYVVSPRTVLRGVKKLGPGQLVEVGPEGSQVHSWWVPPLRRHPRLATQTRGALVEEFNALFTQASERCLVSDVPVALLLSDGIDSQSIRTVLASRGHSIPAYTFRLLNAENGVALAAPPPGSEPIMDIEVSRAERVAQMVPAFGSLTEPLGDGAMLATWMLIRAARSGATVFLCGHGGDEVLGGYRLSQDRFRLALLRRLACLPLGWVECSPRPILVRQRIGGRAAPPSKGSSGVHGACGCPLSHSPPAPVRGHCANVWRSARFLPRRCRLSLSFLRSGSLRPRSHATGHASDLSVPQHSPLCRLRGYGLLGRATHAVSRPGSRRIRAGTACNLPC